jgi:zinc protease
VTKVTAIKQTIVFHTDAGSLVVLEPSHDLPLVDVSITLRTGSTHDPEGFEGLSRLSGRLLRMGTRALAASDVDEAIDRLGAQLSVECTPSSLRFSAVVLARNLEPLFALLGELLCKPALRRDDLALLQRESLADLDELLDNDRALAARHFRRFCLPTHVYGRSVIGSRKSIKRIARTHIADQLDAHLVASNLIIGVAGPVTEAQLRDLIASYLGRLATGTGGRAPKQTIAEPTFAKGRRLLIVDKPERTQTQILIGTLGARALDKDLLPLVLANTVFGGTFSSRLTNAVRSKRGWSYGASSSLGYDRGRDLWSMWTFPAAKDAIDCATLQLELFEQFVAEGITQRELKFAQSFTAKGHAFEVDTAVKRLEHAIEADLMGLPLDFHTHLVRRIGEVELSEANRAVKRRLTARDAAIVMVATASDVRERAAKLPGVTSVEVVPFDSF